MDNYRKCNIRHDWDAIFLEGVALTPVFAPLLPFKNISILLVGGVFGVIRFGLLVLLDDIIGLPADNIGMATNIQTKSHIDPPAGAIAILSLILLGLF